MAVDQTVEGHDSQVEVSASAVCVMSIMTDDASHAHTGNYVSMLIVTECDMLFVCRTFSICKCM